MKNNMIALVMIGGKSRRIGGGIKSLLEFNNKNIFDRILERLSPQIEKIIINCNLEEKKLVKYHLPIIKDLKKGYLGPLAGIHSAMHWMFEHAPQSKWLITIPGDTPFIPDDLIFQFQSKVSKNLNIILAQSNNKTHPVIGAWHTSLFNNLEKHLNTGTRKILTWAEDHSIDFINYDYQKYDPFFNINTKEDLERAGIIEKKFFLKKTE
jgi:molybdopterin-guanine dinucleotide biosynthesis protein A